jgi:hypothetical protein
MHAADVVYPGGYYLGLIPAAALANRIEQQVDTQTGCVNFIYDLREFIQADSGIMRAAAENCCGPEIYTSFTRLWFNP